MTHNPQFPHFRPIELGDRDFIHTILWNEQPETSELTFTSFFIWRTHYHFQWCFLQGSFVSICTTTDGTTYAMEPVGPAPRTDVVRVLLRWLRDEKGQQEPAIERAGTRLAREVEEAGDIAVEPVREHFDYLYRTEDLIALPGRKYHAKRNHISRFLATQSYTYRPVDGEGLAGCLELADRWCRYRRCEEDMGLLEEREAVLESIRHFEILAIQGGMLLVNGRVEAFSFGELLNRDTAVIHIEKANPKIRGLYPLINQQFAGKAWSATTHINREEDLGEEGLRRAKESYHPERLLEKYRIHLAEPTADVGDGKR